jgi:IS5 family transposase
MQLTHAIRDKGYDSDCSRAHLAAHDIVPVIPPKRHRTAAIDYDADLYK